MIGKTLNQYRIVRALGKGGMGEVYLAEDTRLGRSVALKILPASVASDPSRLARFEREARAVAALNHPNIVTIHAVEEAEGIRFLAMEHVEGRTLDTLIPKGGLPAAAILDLAVPLADALSTAHEKGITHRDLKPANIMVNDQGRVKMLDFGLAKHMEIEEGTSLTQVPTAEVTREGVVMGTIPYMSPEQAEGKPVDHRSDIFSLGIILHELASGVRPFKGDTSVSLLSSILKDTPTPLRELRPDLPPDLARIVGRCLEKIPLERFQTARDLCTELRALKRQAESGSAPALPSKRRRGASLLLLAGGLTLLVAVAAGGLWSLGTGRNGREEAASAGGRPAEGADRTMVVVLPFENLGPAEDEYFAAGMADEITSRLASVKGLGVISRKSAMGYTGTDKSIRQIGDELGVAYILEGTIRWARAGAGASRVRITPQLIRVRDDTQV